MQLRALFKSQSSLVKHREFTQWQTPTIVDTKTTTHLHQRIPPHASPSKTSSCKPHPDTDTSHHIPRHLHINTLKDALIQRVNSHNHEPPSTRLITIGRALEPPCDHCCNPIFTPAPTLNTHPISPNDTTSTTPRPLLHHHPSPPKDTNTRTSPSKTPPPTPLAVPHTVRRQHAHLRAHQPPTSRKKPNANNTNHHLPPQSHTTTPYNTLHSTFNELPLN